MDWKEHTVDLVEFALKELLPRHKNVFVDVVFDEELDELYGECVWEEGREFTLRVNPNMPDEIGYTIMHEMVHVKQYLRGELRESFKPFHRRYWKGEEVPEEVGYAELPWEEEAARMEVELFEKWCALRGYEA